MLDSIVPTRRGFLAGLGALIAAPAIVRIQNIMPVKALKIEPPNLYVGRNVLRVLRHEGWVDIGELSGLDHKYDVIRFDEVGGGSGLIKTKMHIDPGLLEIKLVSPRDYLGPELDNDSNSAYQVRMTDGTTYNFKATAMGMSLAIGPLTDPDRQLEARVSLAMNRDTIMVTPSDA